MTPRQVGMPSISRLCMNPRCGNGAGCQSRGVLILVAAILSSPHCRALGGATKRFRMDAHPHDVRKRGVRTRENHSLRSVLADKDQDPILPNGDGRYSLLESAHAS